MVRGLGFSASGFLLGLRTEVYLVWHVDSRPRALAFWEDYRGYSRRAPSEGSFHKQCICAAYMN